MAEADNPAGEAKTSGAVARAAIFSKIPFEDGVIARFFKYGYLLVVVAAMSIVAFNAFSYYVARRDIDSELRSKKGASLEFLLQQGRRRRELALTSLSGRCTERMELALFRIADAESSTLNSAYRDIVAAKNKMVELAEREGKTLIDPESAKKMNLQGFALADYETYVRPVNETIRDSSEYKAFREKMDGLRDAYAKTALKYSDFKDRMDKLAGAQSQNAEFWSMTAISNLTRLNEQTRTELSEQKTKLADYDDVLSRYAVWTDALAGGASPSQLLDDTAYKAADSNEKPMADANCDEFDNYYRAVNGHARDGEKDLGKSFWRLNLAGKFWRINYYYDNFLLVFFSEPPSAQTMFVTLLLGGIGATTLNLLRMSKIGWWNNLDDPHWGEIVVAPFLGALAAFAIFLVGSSGLLLTSDTAGNQPLSGYFIGLLGFLSGLVYDEAFGRVRRVGYQIFSTSVGVSAVTARAEDRSLAQLLQTNGCKLTADLVLLHGLGTALGVGAEFTLLVASDEAMAKLSLGDWRRLNDLNDPYKQSYFEHRLAEKALVSADVKGGPKPLAVKSGDAYQAKLEGDSFTIGGASVIHRDLAWNKGIVQVLAAEPEAAKPA